MSGQDILRYNRSLRYHTEQQQVYLAENMSQSYAHCGCDHGDGHTIHQSVEIATGQVDHDVSPDEGEAHQGVEAQEDGEDCIGRLELSPEQHGVYVVPGESDSLLLVICIYVTASNVQFDTNGGFGICSEL